MKYYYIIIPNKSITWPVYQNTQISVPGYVIKTAFPPPATSEQLFARKPSVKDIISVYKLYNLLNTMVQSFTHCNKVETFTNCFRQMRIPVHFVMQFFLVQPWKLWYEVDPCVNLCSFSIAIQFLVPLGRSLNSVRQYMLYL